MFTAQLPPVATDQSRPIPGTVQANPTLTPANKETGPQGPRLTSTSHLTAGGTEGLSLGNTLFPSFPESGV